MKQTSKNSKIIRAGRNEVYEAFVDKSALETWLAPNNMTGKIHDFDPRAGGGFTMSLFYDDRSTKGKTVKNEDRSTIKFTELKPPEKITQTITFHSDNSDLRDEMTMEVYLEEIDQKDTKVTIVFKNIPKGIDPKDNEAGTAQSLEKLAQYLAKK